MIDEESQIEIIKNELERFSADLIRKPRILVQNKIDCTDKIPNCDFYISCATREGIDDLMNHISKQVALLPRPAESEIEATLQDEIDKNAFDVFVDDSGVYNAKGALIDNLIRGIVLSDTESASYFHRRLDKSGVIAALRDLGMQDGDTVQIADTQFTWKD
jgi:GTP-binding protein